MKTNPGNIGVTAVITEDNAASILVHDVGDKFSSQGWLLVLLLTNCLGGNFPVGLA